MSPEMSDDTLMMRSAYGGIALRDAGALSRFVIHGFPEPSKLLSDFSQRGQIEREETDSVKKVRVEAVAKLDIVDVRRVSGANCPPSYP